MLLVEACPPAFPRVARIRAGVVPETPQEPYGGTPVVFRAARVRKAEVQAGIDEQSLTASARRALPPSTWCRGGRGSRRRVADELRDDHIFVESRCACQQRFDIE
jgi:hypothetical protein